MGGKVKDKMNKKAEAEKLAKKLLKKRVEIEELITDLRKQVKLDAAETKLEKVKEQLVEAMVAAGVDQVGVDGHHATLVRAGYGAMFVATEDDLRDIEIPEDREVKSMREIIRESYGAFRKGSNSSIIWKRITRPVVVPALVEEAVNEGLLNVDEISAAFIERQKKPYARVFKDD